ncbi:hypothetical protein, partial [Kibdelosporangium philippinense]|uniref:hypothetical protein n=1 Tax=Kibdelosporangium philippinense TaxID=211113 RepID=UPI0036091838
MGRTGGQRLSMVVGYGGRPLPDAARPAKNNPTDAQLAQALRDVLVDNKAHEVPAWDDKSRRPLINSTAWREIDNVTVNIGQRLHNLKKKPTARVGRRNGTHWGATVINGCWIWAAPLPDAAEPA